jgi:hypothetical protein
MMLTMLLLAVAVHADGWNLVEGRFPTGKSTVIGLTAAQAARLVFLHACRHDNSRTPYLFRLNARQSDLLKRHSGIAATRFAVIDSSKGDVDVDIPINVLVRFAELRAEIPHALLGSDAEARRYEVETMGWRHNPLEELTQAQVRRGSCPR